MDGAGARIAAAVRAGAAFTAVAWRDAWAVLALLALGIGTAFAASHLDTAAMPASQVQAAGAGLALLTILPALGALYRSAVGGPRLREIGFGGLQAGAVELRILGVLALTAVGAMLGLAPLALVGGAIWYPLREAGVVRLPMIGPFGLWFVLAAPALLLVGGAVAVALARIGLALPAAAAERTFSVGKALRSSRRWAGSLAVTGWLTEILPCAVLAGVAVLLTRLEREQGGAIWPLTDTLVAAGALSFAFAFLVLPFGVGARTAFYGRALAEQRAARRRMDLQAAGVTELKPPSRPAVGAAPAASDAIIDAEFEPIAASAEAEEAPAPDAATGERKAASGVVIALPGPAPSPRVEPDEAVAARWTPPVAPLGIAGLAQAVTTPVLLAHANDREPSAPWWFPPEHPEGPPVA